MLCQIGQYLLSLFYELMVKAHYTYHFINEPIVRPTYQTLLLSYRSNLVNVQAVIFLVYQYCKMSHVMCLII